MGFHLKEIFTGLLPVRRVPGEKAQDAELPDAELVAAFEAHKKAGSKALLVFTDLTGAKKTYMGPPADCADLDAHIAWNMEQDPFRLHKLIGIVDTARPLEGQWPQHVEPAGRVAPRP